MATWLDYREPGRVAAAMSELAGRRPEQRTAQLASAGGDGRYALWLTIAFDRLAEHPPANVSKSDGAAWPGQYRAGVPPLSAAFSAWTGAAVDPEITAALTRCPW